MNPKNRKPEEANGKAANGGANGQSNSASALAKAVSLHLEGKRKEALQELKGAIASGGDSAHGAVRDGASVARPDGGEAHAALG